MSIRVAYEEVKKNVKQAFLNLALQKSRPRPVLQFILSPALTALRATD